MQLPAPIQNAVRRLAELPGIGPRQATRLVFFLIGEGGNAIHGLATGLLSLAKIKICERCFFVHQNAGTLCDICGDAKRDQRTIIVVEKETDLLSLERTGKFSGRYLIVGAMPRTGSLEQVQVLRLQRLQNFIKAGLGGQAEEVILGFNPTAEGDFHAALVAKELGPFAKRMTRLGRGLPTGGEIEFADDETLGNALERRSG